MKKIFFAAFFTVIGLSLNAQTKKPATVAKPSAAKPTATKKTVTATKPITKAPVFKNNLDSACYALGLNVASSFKAGGLNTINYEAFNQGLRDALTGADPTLNAEKAQEAINKLFESFSKQREEMEKQKYAANVNEGATFLAQNKNKPGIKTTASGLQYEVITAGTGPKPQESDNVTVHYRGTLLNGTQFDSSYDRGTPATFGLNQVIRGWTEGVQLMPEGSKYRFFIPYQLAYGSRATPDGSIPPFSTLIFEVELLKVGQ